MPGLVTEKEERFLESHVIGLGIHYLNQISHCQPVNGYDFNKNNN